jgi:outer membrane lipoprotein SlyB
MAGWAGGAIGGATGLAAGAVAGKAISPAFRGAGNVMEGIGRFLQRDSGTYMKQISEIAPQRVANLAKATLMALARGDGAYRAAVYIFVHQPEVQEWLHANLQGQEQ